MKNIAIITARGGSKRIPRKNIKLFCGIPIIAYSIRAALASHIFEEVMVSTDDEEIAMIAKKYGASIPFMRSKENSDDFATTGDVLAEVIEEYKKIGKQFDYICCIYPTAPFITAKKLMNAYKKLMEKNADSLLPVVRFSYPPQRCFIMDAGKLVYKYPQYIRSRSQDLDPLYHDVGQFYFARTDAFLREKNNLITSNTIPYLVPETEVQDIDNLDDWKLAEMKYKNMDYLLNFVERAMAIHECQYESYFVCFVDVLGTREEISNSQRPADLSFLSLALNGLNEANKQFRKNLYMHMFSDCAYIAAKEDDVDSLLEYVSMFTWQLLGDQNKVHLLRGGMSFGRCYCGDDFFIGPAMVEAYLLESDKNRNSGGKPRILVDASAQSKLKEMGKENGIKAIGGNNDVWFIDFLEILERLRPDAMLTDAMGEIQESVEKLSSKVDAHVKAKYDYMAKYLGMHINT